MLNELRETCRGLLRDGTVEVVIGYGQDAPDEPAYPLFVTEPEQVERLVWNDRCFPNLVTYLTRPEVRKLGKPAVVVKPCDARALVVLETEQQIDRSQIVVIGMACEGVGDPRQRKCEACEIHTPQGVDVVIGQAEDRMLPVAERYRELDVFLEKPAEERIAWWREELSRCVKCYACRQVCPMCYCRQCIADKNRPQCIDTSATSKGNFAWHITRAFHLAGRCVGCDECTRVCPAGIDLRLLNQSLAREAEESFQYRAGTDPEAEPLIGAYAEGDREDFIQ